MSKWRLRPEATHLSLQGQTMTLTLYAPGSDIKAVELQVPDPGVPLTVGAEFVVKVVGVTREVTER